MRIGVHTCPGGGSVTPPIAPRSTMPEWLPCLFQLKASGIFTLRFPCEQDRARNVKNHPPRMKPEQRNFIGITNSDRPAHRDLLRKSGIGSWKRPNILPARPAWHHRRLRLFAFLRRYFHQPRHGVQKDSGAGTGDRAGMEENFRLIGRGDVKHDLTMEYGWGVRIPMQNNHDGQARQ